MNKTIFAEIYAEYSKRVFNTALHYVHNTHDAEEITQDVFITVYESYHTFNRQSSLSTWIYRIAINKSLDFLNAKKRKKRFGLIIGLFTNDEDNEIPHSFDHPGVSLEQKEATERIFLCINELPDNQKTALILNKIEQQSQSQIAEIMGLSAKAVESLIQRAKINLEKKLNRNEGL